MSEQAMAEQTMAMPKHGEFCWTEISTDNLEACRSFYAEVFGWNIQQSQNSGIEMEYLEFETASGCPTGGMVEMKPEWYGGTIPKPHFSIYIAVEDVDEAASKAFDLGATIVTPPMDIPQVGRFCEVKDPTGANFSMITLKP
jgi:uncharacterized protein